ncbi:FAD-binding oxidoreductase [Mesorhizobium sp. NZP2234]|uniref:NAD(P)/FAD-dependent oxidoreductase n=1 Tax=Mesorhizobium sp. NZP2234 TaxID=2483402 RepID=UPI0015528693|nr:FAD-binding oxidoreductase [Mesorhizobium sp. NZP2234]QKC91965.1 FAD-binding oxidoreductase [Mesorhizobium sp. NZP2234]
MRNGSDVIVVGAGIVGSSTAYHLAKAGANVLLVEQTHPAGGPSGKSSALLHAFYLMPELSQLSIRGREILVSLPEIAGEGSFVTEIGMMWVCGNDNKASWTTAAERIRGEGARIETLSPQAFADAAPGFALDNVALALWEPEFGYADAFGATNAIARAARANGAKILQNTLVENLRRQGDRIAGVTLTDGTVLEADTVVLAAGPWTRRLLATVGLDLPLHVERHPMAVLDAAGQARKVMPFAWCDDISCNYARPDNDGVILAGTWAGGGTGLRHEHAGRPRFVENPDAYMEGVEESESVEILETFATRVPAMAELGIRPGYAGLYDMSPDDLPVIGAMPGVEGLVVSAGSSGHGFKTGPAVGEAIAKLVTEGPQPILAPFSLSRFKAA